MLSYTHDVAQYREISEVPGHKPTKPIEVGLIDTGGDGSATRYMAVHNLPSLKKELGMNRITAMGSTEKEACEKLGLALAKRLEDLNDIGYKKVLTLDERLEKQYLKTLIEGKIF